MFYYGGCFALVSSGLIITSIKLETKISRHQEITTLAVAKRDIISKLLSKALKNNAGAHECLSEWQQYNFLKEQIRAKLLRQAENLAVDVEKPINLHIIKT